jgi:hypothetical protein
VGCLKKLIAIRQVEAGKWSYVVEVPQTVVIPGHLADELPLDMSNELLH